VAIGDSVMQGAGPGVYGTLAAVLPGVLEDCAPHRQFRHAQALLAAALAGSPAPGVVVVGLGTNGPVQPAAVDRLMDLTAAAGHRLLLVDVRVPRDWEAQVNQTLRAAASRRPGDAAVVAWSERSRGEPALLARDGFHLSRHGAVAYAELLAGAVLAEAVGPRGVAGPGAVDGARSG
jgi:lysophospholipase L1-like esterase